MSCRRTQEFLAKNGIETVELVDARKTRLGPKAALDLAKTVDEIYVARGSRVVHLDLKTEKPDAATLTRLIMGPSGNLRAPTLRAGRTLLVGFDETSYRRILRR